VNQVALAVGRAALDQMIQDSMNDQFPGVNTDDGAEVDDGRATLYTLTVTPSDVGGHDQSEGHLWSEGSAEVHIDCWPDPDVTFSGPIFLRVILTETEEECSIRVNPEMGEFDAGQSCCDVFIDILIPVVGIVMLIVIESMIDEIGGQLAEEFAGEQARNIEALPPFVAGVAELQACIEDLRVSSQGLVFPASCASGAKAEASKTCPKRATCLAPERNPPQEAPCPSSAVSSKGSRSVVPASWSRRCATTTAARSTTRSPTSTPTPNASTSGCPSWACCATR
jgi:hypothetical protein